ITDKLFRMFKIPLIPLSSCCCSSSVLCLGHRFKLCQFLARKGQAQSHFVSGCTRKEELTLLSYRIKSIQHAIGSTSGVWEPFDIAKCTGKAVTGEGKRRETEEHRQRQR